MAFKIFNVIRSGILAQGIFFAEGASIQAQPPSSYSIQHPQISAVPKRNNPDNNLLSYLLLGGIGSVGIGIAYGIKSIMNYKEQKLAEFREVISEVEKANLQKKLSRNQKLKRTIEKILKERGGIDPNIYK